jgi:hypothetical protein
VISQEIPNEITAANAGGATSVADADALDSPRWTLAQPSHVLADFSFFHAQVIE